MLHEGLVYLVGGFNGQSRIRSVDIFNPLTREWSSGPEMQYRRATLGLAIIKTKMYAIGGFDGISGLDSVECWHIKTTNDSKWSTLLVHTSPH